MFSSWRPLTFFVLTTVLLLANPFSNLLARQEASIESYHKAAPESPLVFASWQGWSDFDPNRSATEKWMGQDELVNGFKKLKKELLKSIKANIQSEEDQAAAHAGFHLAFSAIENPGFFILYDFQAEEKWGADFHFHLSLENHHQALDEFFPFFVEKIRKEEKAKLEEHQFEGRLFYSVQVDEMKHPVFWAMDKQGLTVTSSLQRISDWKKRSQTPPPKWLTNCKETLKVDHLQSVVQIRVKDIRERIEKVRGESVLNLSKDATGFRKLETISMVSGLNPSGSVMKGRLKFEPGLVPIIDIFSREGFAAEELAHLKKGDHYNWAFHLKADKVLELAEVISEVSDQPESLKESFEEFKEEFSFDLQTVLSSLGPKAFVTGQVMLPNPLLGLGVRAEIDDYGKFAHEMTKGIEGLKSRLEEMPEEQRPVLSEKNGFPIIQFPLGESGKMFLAHNKKRVAIAFSKRKVLRLLKSAPVAHSVTEIPYVKNVLDPKFMANGRPSVLIVSDPRPSIQMFYPLLLGFIPSDQKLPGTDLSVRDLPSLDTLIRGWEPTVIAVYRTKDGVEFVSQSTVPGISPSMLALLVSGVAWVGFEEDVPLGPELELDFEDIDQPINR